MKLNLRAPLVQQVIQWGKNLGLSASESRAVSDNLLLRGQLGNVKKESSKTRVRL